MANTISATLGFSFEALDCVPVVNASGALMPGEIVGLSGTSGSGKSRLLRALADLIPQRGSIYLDGQSMDRYPPTQWRRLVCLLPTDSQWWATTVAEHFSSAPHAYLPSLSLNPETLQQAPQQLSSGQRQLHALLRVLMLKPRVLLLDEPTSSVDPARTLAVEKLVIEFISKHNCSAIWVSHDPLQLKRISKRQWFMQAGRLLSQ